MVLLLLEPKVVLQALQIFIIKLEQLIVEVQVRPGEHANHLLGLRLFVCLVVKLLVD